MVMIFQCSSANRTEYYAIYRIPQMALFLNILVVFIDN